MEEAAETLNEFISNYLPLGEENVNSFKIERIEIKDINFFIEFYKSIKKLYEFYPQIDLVLFEDRIHIIF